MSVPVGFMDNCCDCGKAGACPSCDSIDPVGGKVIGVWEAAGTGYEDHNFTDKLGRYVIIYCGGAFGYTAHIEPFPGFPQFWSVWNTLALIYGDHAWLNPQWIPPWEVIALRYGVHGDVVDLAFGGQAGNLGTTFLASFPPLTGIPFAGTETWPPDGTSESPFPLGATYVGVGTNSKDGNANDAAAATLSQQRLMSAMPAAFGNCKYYPFKSDGTAAVRMQFTAPLYSGDGWPHSVDVPVGPGFMIKKSSIGGPKFALVQKLETAFTAKLACCSVVGGAYQYVVNLFFTNDSDFGWDGTAHFSGPGVVVIAGQDQGWACQPHFQTHVSFGVNAANLSFQGLLTLSDSLGKIIDLTYDLSPVITGVQAVSNGVSFVNPTRNRLTLFFTSSHGMPLADLQVRVFPLGGVTASYDPFTAGPPQNVFDIGSIGGCGGSSTVFDISTSTVKPTAIDLTVQFLNSGAATPIPNATIHVPLVWP